MAPEGKMAEMPKLESGDRRFLLLSLALVPAGLALAVVHPFFTILAGPFSAGLTFRIFDVLSWRLFGKAFAPPSRVAGMPSPAWSDWLLFLPWILVFVALLFAFGEVGNCLGERRFWNGWVRVCG
jgi:hypothetical protein